VVRRDFSPPGERVLASYADLGSGYTVAGSGSVLLVFESSDAADLIETEHFHLFGDLELFPAGDVKGSVAPSLEQLAHRLADGGGSPLSTLRGDFAFAFADEDKRTVLLARDRLGTRALYWSTVGDDLVFATVPSLIARHPDYHFDVDRHGVASGILEADGDRTRTAWRGIWRVAAGSFLEWEGAGTTAEHRYWSPSIADVEMTRDEAVEGLRHAFRRAVRRRFRSGDTGAFLSGGLDSSSIVCVAADDGIDLLTFTLRFPGDELADEGGFVDTVAQKYGLRNVTVDIGEQAYVPDWRATGMRGSPDLFYYPNLQMLEPLYEAAAENGIGRLLDGVGGDHLLHATAAPLDLIADAVRAGDVREAWRLFQQWPAIDPMGRIRGVLRLLLRRAAPPHLRFLWGRWKSQFPARHVPLRLALDSGLARELYPWRRPEFTRQTKKTTAETMTSRYHLERWLEQNYLLAHCHGIEQVSPYVDSDLVEFVLSVPLRYVFDPYVPRWLQRESMKGILPEEIRTRTDKGEFDRFIGHVIKEQLVPGARAFFDEHGIEASSLVADRTVVDGWIRKIETGPPGWEIPLFLETLNYEKWLAEVRTDAFFAR
ncbi:MAG: hypothetical protein KY432_10220, partial [Acidobacteria bacterium]|nr:hypothetical protein [Acidobacteriota bacterium]